MTISYYSQDSNSIPWTSNPRFSPYKNVPSELETVFPHSYVGAMLGLTAQVHTAKYRRWGWEGHGWDYYPVVVTRGAQNATCLIQ